MDKLVTLKIGNSSSERLAVCLDAHNSEVSSESMRRCDSNRGYSVTLEIAEERWLGDRIWLNNQVEQRGQLPPASELLKNYRDWQQSYRNLDVDRRLEADPAQITNISAIDLVSQCQRAAQRSLDAFDRWLNAESFHQIREHLAKNIAATDRVRFLLQIDDPQLYCLPWQLGEMFANYSSTEVVLSSPSFENIQPANPVTKSGVRILAILGNSQGINIETDRKILENLPKVQVKFLVEPHRQELTDSLWAQNWDILFFAGQVLVATIGLQGGFQSIEPIV
jgi:hypothetical protein